MAAQPFSHYQPATGPFPGMDPTSDPVIQIIEQPQASSKKDKKKTEAVKPCFEMWIIRKATVEGKEKSWKCISKEQIQHNSDDLEKEVQKRGRSSIEDFTELETLQQRQVNALVEDRQAEELHPDAEWTWARIQLDMKSKSSRKSQGKPRDARGLLVILQRRSTKPVDKQPKASKSADKSQRPDIVDLEERMKTSRLRDNPQRSKPEAQKPDVQDPPEHRGPPSSSAPPGAVPMGFPQDMYPGQPPPMPQPEPWPLHAAASNPFSNARPWSQSSDQPRGRDHFQPKPNEHPWFPPADQPHGPDNYQPMPMPESYFPPMQQSRAPEQHYQPGPQPVGLGIHTRPSDEGAYMDPSNPFSPGYFPEQHPAESSQARPAERRPSENVFGKPREPDMSSPFNQGGPSQARGMGSRPGEKVSGMSREFEMNTHINHDQNGPRANHPSMFTPPSERPADQYYDPNQPIDWADVERQRQKHPLTPSDESDEFWSNKTSGKQSTAPTSVSHGSHGRVSSDNFSPTEGNYSNHRYEKRYYRGHPRNSSRHHSSRYYDDGQPMLEPARTRHRSPRRDEQHGRAARRSRRGAEVHQEQTQWSTPTSPQQYTIDRQEKSLRSPSLHHRPGFDRRRSEYSAVTRSHAERPVSNRRASDYTEGRQNRGYRYEREHSPHSSGYRGRYVDRYDRRGEHGFSPSSPRYDNSDYYSGRHSQRDRSPTPSSQADRPVAALPMEVMDKIGSVAEAVQLIKEEREHRKQEDERRRLEEQYREVYEKGRQDGEYGRLQHFDNVSSRPPFLPDRYSR